MNNIYGKEVYRVENFAGSLTFSELHEAFQGPNVEFLGENAIGDEPYLIRNHQGAHFVLCVQSEILKRRNAQIEIEGYRAVTPLVFDSIRNLVTGWMVPDERN